MSLIDRIMRRKPIVGQATKDTSLSDAARPLTSMKTGWTWGDLGTQTEVLSIQDKRNAYRGNPIVFKGINKKARDCIYDGFEIDNPLDQEDVPEPMEQTINDFLINERVYYTVNRCLQDAFSVGNGFFEYVCKGNKDPEQPIMGDLATIKYINPELIINYKPDKYNMFVEYWIYQNKNEKIPIHSSRIEHFGFYQDGDNPFSRSPIDIAQRAIKACNDATVALGDNIDLFGHPFPTINTPDNVNQKHLEAANEVLLNLKKKKLKVGFAGFKDTKFAMLNPNSPNTQYSLNHFYIELAAALEMPMMFLIGEQKGKLTGSEIELNDYYKSISSIQEIHLSPVFHKMFRMLVGDSWKYAIRWNPLYVDEKSEIDNKTKLIKELSIAYEKGIVDIIEVRQILREYDVNIPEGGELDEEIEEEVEEPVEQLPFIEYNKKPMIRTPTKEELKQAEKLRLAHPDHIRGEQELEEQEKRLRKTKN